MAESKVEKRDLSEKLASSRELSDRLHNRREVKEDPLEYVTYNSYILMC